MEWINDSKACLETAQILLEEIEELTPETIKDDFYIPYLKVKIKNCLENCRSPLDYAAHYIFESYCKTEYSSRELRKHKTYFPIRKTESLFDVAIRDDFRKLHQKRNDIVLILKQCQSFNGDPWLQHLTVLTNENKHRNLTKQFKEQTTHIKSGQIGGITLNNVTMVNVGTPIQYEGTKIDFVNQSPYDHLFDATVSIEYFFDDLNLSVIPTLSNIYRGAISVINDLEKKVI